MDKEVKKYIPNISTMADLYDRLIIELNKASFFEMMKRKEQGKVDKDEKAIAFWDDMSRDAIEYRSLIKNAINTVLKEIVDSGEYKVLAELRTFRRPEKSFEDLLADRAYILGENVIKQLEKEYNVSLDY